MRRALIAFLAAAPVYAAAQSSTPALGTIDTDPDAMNIAQCNGTVDDDNRIPPLDDEANLSLTWQVKLDSSQTTFPTTGRFKVWASLEPFLASNGTAPWSCDRDSGNSEIVRKQIGESDGYEAPSQTMGVPEEIAFDTIPGNEITLDCNSNTTGTIYLCVEWMPDGINGTPKGWAAGNIGFDTKVPGMPTITSLSAGDRKLHIEGCTEGTNNQDFIASAANGTEVHWSGVVDSCRDITIGGLTNRQPYDVTLYALSSAGNPSAPSVAVSGTPILTDDFWQHYDGQDSGGCATGAGAAGLLGALALLALTTAVRRRKS